MESTQSVLSSIHQRDWMISVVMKDTYFHIPVHPRSRKFLRFVFNNQTYQFGALFFGLSFAPQVLTRVFGPLAEFVNLAWIGIILYLDDWLLLVRSQRDEGSNEVCAETSSRFGDFSKYGKVSISPNSEVCLSGDDYRFREFLSFPSSETKRVRSQRFKNLSAPRSSLLSFG